MRGSRLESRRATCAREEAAARRAFAETVLASVRSKHAAIEGRLRMENHRAVGQRLLVELQAVAALGECLEELVGQWHGEEASATARVLASTAA